MRAVIVRRKGLGRESTKGIAGFLGEDVSVVLNSQMKPSDFDGCDIVIRWGCTSTVPVKSVINKAKAIHNGANKSVFRKMMMESGEELCPDTYFDIDDWFEAIGFPDENEQLNQSVIVRPKNHHQGRDLYFCDTVHQVVDAMAKCGDDAYINDYIRKVSEYRVYVVQGRAVAVNEKIPEDNTAISWNHHGGGSHYQNVRWDNWPLDGVDKAIKASNLAGLDFCGVDVIVDGTGKAYVLEVNSAPTTKTIQDGDRKGEPTYTQSCMAKGIKYMLDFGKDCLPVSSQTDSYRRYIHPAITNKAEL